VNFSTNEWCLGCDDEQNLLGEYVTSRVDAFITNPLEMRGRISCAGNYDITINNHEAAIIAFFIFKNF